MRMTDNIFVNKDVQQVYRFFIEPENLAKWDRSVAKVVRTSPGPVDVGATFNTIGPASERKPGLVTSYRVQRLEEDQRMDVLLTDSNLFKSGCWSFSLAPHESGTNVHCTVEFSLKGKYAMLAPLIFLNKGAISRDLNYLKTELERAQ